MQENKLIRTSTSRISDLPDSILNRILSFLSLQQAAGTCLVSKQWNRVWSTLPYLNFRGLDHIMVPYNVVRNENWERLISFVDPILLRFRNQGISIHRFQITVRDDQEFRSCMRRWIKWLAECNIRELQLVLFPTDSKVYKLPSRIFNAKSLTSLKLTGCNLRLHRAADQALPSLQVLHLSFLVVDSRLTQNLARVCPRIEDLKLICFVGFRSIRVSGLLKLNRFHLGLSYRQTDLHKIEVEAPNLQSFIYNENSTRCRTINIASCKSLKSVTICNAAITETWFHDLFPKLYLLEKLCLQNCYSPKKIHISSYALQHLELKDCWNLIDADIETPNLRSFWYNGEIFSLSLNATASSPEAEVHPGFYGPDEDASNVRMVTAFIGKFDRSKVEKLCSNEVMNFIIPYKARKSLTPPQPNFKHLKFFANFLTSPGLSNINVLDTFLRNFPNLETLSILSNQLQFPLEVLYQKFKARREKLCRCKFRIPGLSCSQHCMKAVKFEKLDVTKSKRLVGEGDDLDGFRVITIRIANL